MTVGQLEKMLAQVKDKSIPVMIPLDEDIFISPDLEESGVEEMEFNGELEESFVLAPLGYYSIVDDEIDPQMN